MIRKIFNYKKRLNQLGESSLLEQELLSLVLQKREAVIEKLMKLCCGNISYLYNLSDEEMLEISGFGKEDVMRLRAILELSVRISKYRNTRNKYTTPSQVYNLYKEELRHSQKEICKLVCLDTKNKIIAAPLLSINCIDYCLIDPREIFLEAIKHRAVKVIVMHSHPSGDPRPSDEDKLITERIVECGNLLRIPVIDHIIVGNDYYSFGEAGLIKKEG